jgi:hypothetical protein
MKKKGAGYDVLLYIAILNPGITGSPLEDDVSSLMIYNKNASFVLFLYDHRYFAGNIQNLLLYWTSENLLFIFHDTFRLIKNKFKIQLHGIQSVRMFEI